MEKKYCIYCGAENDRQAKFCTKCGKEMNPAENLLIDFLVKRTKDKFRDETVSTVYEALKNWLLSHLYGVMLTISFASAVAATAYASQPYIQKMDGDVMAVINGSYSEIETDRPVNSVYPTEYNSAVHDLITHYEFQVFNTQQRDGRGNITATNPDALRLPASYGYNGVHELDPSLPTDIEGASESGTKNRTEFEPENHTTDIARQLTDDGYTVGECVVEKRFEDNDGQIVTSYEYMLVAVLVNDEWLVAEDRIIEVYTPAPQPVSYDFDTLAALDAASDYYQAVLKGGDGSHLLADSLLGYSVQHQLVYDEDMPYGEEGSDTETYYTDLLQTDEFINNISAVLRNEGYNVMEYLFEQTIYDVNNNYRVIGARDFCVTVVEIDGNWYVTEDIVVYRTVY